MLLFPTKVFFFLIADEPPEEEEEVKQEGGGNNSETGDSIHSVTELVAEQHSNTTLVCDRQRNDTVHKVTLERRLHDNQPWGLIGACRKIEGGPLAQNYSDRGRLSCTDTLGVSLHLTDVQQQDAGLYRCTWSTDGALQTTITLLKVLPAGTETLDISKRSF